MAVKPPKIALDRIPTDKTVIYSSVRHSLRQYAASLGLFSDDGGPWDLEAFDSLDKEKQKDEVWNAIQAQLNTKQAAPAPKPAAAPAPAPAPAQSAKQPEPEVVTTETVRRGRGRPPKAASADMPPQAAKQPEAAPQQPMQQAPTMAQQSYSSAGPDPEVQQVLSSIEVQAAKAAANSQETHREVMEIKDVVAANTQLLKAVMYFMASVAEGQGLAEDWRDLVKDAIGHKDCVDITGAFEKGK